VYFGVYCLGSVSMLWYVAAVSCNQLECQYDAIGISCSKAKNGGVYIRK
jgi:hypothetical protein